VASVRRVLFVVDKVRGRIDNGFTGPLNGLLKADFLFFNFGLGFSHDKWREHGTLPFVISFFNSLFVQSGRWKTKTFLVFFFCLNRQFIVAVRLHVLFSAK
jgi:hypothetical protein